MAETPHIDPTAEGIGHAIADKHPIVPLRQRFYAWTKDEVLQLFEDLENAINDDSNEDYFLGLVVVIQKGHSRPEVLDGQQRLATCVMLLAAIRDYSTFVPPAHDTSDEMNLGKANPALFV